MEPNRLESFLSRRKANHPQKTAVVDPKTGSMSYAELSDLACHLSGLLLEEAQVSPNDRIGLCIPKSISSVASIFATLISEACYVPVDSCAPMQRIAFIFADCSVRAILVHRPLREALTRALADQDVNIVSSLDIELPDVAGAELVLLVTDSIRKDTTEFRESLAYILYTSGSTGKPKGVIHSHSTALSFVDWCSEEFAPRSSDVFSSHAPFHFDLSILDLYLSLKHGATLVLIGESDGKQPMILSSLIAEHKISVWYSTPSILRLLVDYGKLEEKDYSTLRLVLYAGEVFPLKHLKALTEALPGPVYYNLYGPTETNVCTFRRIPFPLPNDESLPRQIGTVCSGDLARVVNESGIDVTRGEEGELWICGGSVHLGYWNLPQRNTEAFATDANGDRWYKTGDLVIEQDGGDFLFIGRRDRMIKRRGFRVELGEIENILYSHENISEAAVIANPDADSDLQLLAFIQWSGDNSPSILELKRFCSENLVSYMVPDRFIVLKTLPKTSTDKIDYQMLKEMG
jgi:amino acid adenylation domain-containing protein